MIEKPQIVTEIKQIVIQKQYEHMAKTADYYLSAMKQRDGNSFTELEAAIRMSQK